MFFDPNIMPIKPQRTELKRPDTAVTFSSLFYGNKLNSQLWLKLRIGLEKVHYFYSQAVFQTVAPRDAEILKQL